MQIAGHHSWPFHGATSEAESFTLPNYSYSTCNVHECRTHILSVRRLESPRPLHHAARDGGRGDSGTICSKHRPAFNLHLRTCKWNARRTHSATEVKQLNCEPASVERYKPLIASWLQMRTLGVKRQKVVNKPTPQKDMSDIPFALRLSATWLKHCEAEQGGQSQSGRKAPQPSSRDAKSEVSPLSSRRDRLPPRPTNSIWPHSLEAACPGMGSPHLFLQLWLPHPQAMREPETWKKHRVRAMTCSQSVSVNMSQFSQSIITCSLMSVLSGNSTSQVESATTSASAELHRWRPGTGSPSWALHTERILAKESSSCQSVTDFVTCS